MIGLAGIMMQAVAEHAGLPNEMLFVGEPPTRHCNCWRCKSYFAFVEACPLRMSSVARRTNTANPRIYKDDKRSRKQLGL